MKPLNELEFVNRLDELAAFSDFFEKNEGSSSILLLVSPSGFGKTRLTNELKLHCSLKRTTFCYLDITPQGDVPTKKLHSGYYVQKFARQLSFMADESMSFAWPSIADYLNKRKSETLKEKNIKSLFSEFPSMNHLYKITADYSERFFSYGHFSPEEITDSDKSDCVNICVEYIEFITSKSNILLIIRESQNCDQYSLKVMLSIQKGNSLALLLEYTNSENKVNVEFEKILYEGISVAQPFWKHDLLRLDKDKLDYLVHQCIGKNIGSDDGFYLKWTGNIRSIVELGYQVSIGRSFSTQKHVENVISENNILKDHIRQLSILEQTILAISIVNIEPISIHIVSKIVESIFSSFNRDDVYSAILQLASVHGFINKSNFHIVVSNDSVIDSFNKTEQAHKICSIIEVKLRDYYSDMINRGCVNDPESPKAIRQLFRLCAKTKDLIGLLKASTSLAEEIKKTNDQSAYVEIIFEAIKKDTELYILNCSQIIEWTAELAYEICDWPRVAELCSTLPFKNNFIRSMLACSLQEIGRHDEALLIAREIHKYAADQNDNIVAWLIESMIEGCRGNIDYARVLLTKCISNKSYPASPLSGYAYRFFEITDDFPGCLEKMNKSIDVFSIHRLEKSKAYSQLPAAVLKARSGDIDGARKLHYEAMNVLENELQDKHILLNNFVAIELLSDDPDYNKCKDCLLKALRYVKDDYSELTIISNIGICYLGLGDYMSAVDYAEKAFFMLDHHDFADKDIYWPVCYNAGKIMELSNNHGKKGEILKYPLIHGRALRINKEYWDYRYGLSDVIDERYTFLAKSLFHPLYLSHWLIDLEGINLLRKGSLQ